MSEKRRFGVRGGAGVVLVAFAAALFGMASTAPQHGEAAARDLSDAQAIAHGNRIAALLTEGRYADLVALFEPQTVTCPLSTPGGPMAICEGIPDGGTVQGYLGGTFGSDAGASLAEPFLAGFEPRRAAFTGTTFRLYTFARSGRGSGFLGCPECWTVIITTPEETRKQPDVDRRGPYLYEFQLLPVGNRLAIFSVVFGGPMSYQALITGGEFEGRQFITVAPGAPATGTGPGAGGPFERGWSATTASVVALPLTVALLVLAWSTLARRERRR